MTSIKHRNKSIDALGIIGMTKRQIVGQTCSEIIGSAVFRRNIQNKKEPPALKALKFNKCDPRGVT